MGTENRQRTDREQRIRKLRPLYSSVDRRGSGPKKTFENVGMWKYIAWFNLKRNQKACSFSSNFIKCRFEFKVAKQDYNIKLHMFCITLDFAFWFAAYICYTYTCVPFRRKKRNQFKMHIWLMQNFFILGLKAYRISKLFLFIQTTTFWK